MAQYLDSKADVSEGEEELDQNERKKLKAMGESDNEEDEDDEDPLHEELKDLIDDNPIGESEGEDNDGSDHHKKHKKSDEDFEDRLEDCELLEENLSVKLQQKRSKRLRRIQDEESEEKEQKEADEERDAIANQLCEGCRDEDERRSEQSHRSEVEDFEKGSLLQIRNTDIPEKTMQLRSVPVTSASENELEQEESIYKQANVCKSTISIQDAHLNAEAKERKYLFDNSSKILNNLSVNDEHEARVHYVFYYAIRSNKVELLDTLINEWPNNYFRELDEIISRAYEELKLKNVPLSEEIEISVENKLIDLRFFSNASGQDQNVKDYLNNIRERVELVLQNISLLKAEYSNTEKVDKKFLFIAKFIAQNIHILKRQLKSTYDRLPWEEIEFCLVSFVSSHIKRQEINLFYHATLNKSKILNHLENFAKRLNDEKDIIECVDIGKFADLPKLKREKVVAEIVSNYPQFAELYSNYQQIRDIHSLEKISDYIKLALSADPEQRKGQLIITRFLQVIGEYLKNTAESPNLSNTTSKLLKSLPMNTRKYIKDLRNSLSHAHSLFMKTEIKKNTNDIFFIGVQNETKRIDNVIADILYNRKSEIIRTLLEKFTNSESLDEMKEVGEIFGNIELDETITESFKVMEHEKLEKLIKQLSDNITVKENKEKELFNKINNIINCAETKSENIRTNNITTFMSLKTIGYNLNLHDNKIDHNVIRTLKLFANKTLENIASPIESHNLKEIADLSMKIAHSARSRKLDNLDEVDRITCEIICIAAFRTGDLKWIEKFRNMLKKEDLSIPKYKQRKGYCITEKNYNNLLKQKILELKDILENNKLSGKLNEKLYKRDKKLQAVVEMLVLDIMSILDELKHLESNPLFLDDNTPLLTGKCLRNYLAHGNTLVDILLSDPSIAVILNAKKLTPENVIKSKKKFGKLVRDDPSKLKDKYDQNLITITNQEKMFAALEKGNFEDVISYVRKGADITARSINSWTTLHIAAAHGRINIVEPLLKEPGIYVDDLDNSGRTPLHIAAKNGHKDTVEILLKNNANTNTKDIAGFSPLHYAILNNHIDIAKTLPKEKANVNKTMDGFTSLHIAAESGYLELVNYLLETGAKVNAEGYKGLRPLHTAAQYGHLEVVNALISAKADVNSRTIDDCTPLHYAIANGHEKIANILLKHGANVNAVDKTYNNTPLHYAAKYGHEKIVETLLKNKVDASVATVQGITPLHFAALSGHLKIVAALLKHGVNIRTKDKNNATSLHYAAESGHKEVAELLIEKGAEINDKDNNNRTPLYVAALKGHKDIIEFLIEYEIDIKAQDIEGRTPLHAAATNGSKDIIDLLLNHGAEVDARTHNDMTPLHVAALSGHEDAIAFLIKSKAEVNTKNNSGFTPLHAAVVRGHIDIVKLLIEKAAEVNAKSIVDSTSLHLAVKVGHKEIVEILVANGANVNVKSNDLTPLLCAIKHNHKEIVEVLIEKGASVNAEGLNPLLLAAFTGYTDIVEILLKKGACIDMKGPEDVTPLHAAAERGHKIIINTLNGEASVDAMTIKSHTPLYLAAKEGHEDVVEVLLSKGAKINVKDKEDRTPLEVAAAFGHLQVVKILLQYKEVDKNAVNKLYRRPLKITDNKDIINLLASTKKLFASIIKRKSSSEVENDIRAGAFVNAKNAYGGTPLHYAAWKGCDGVVEVLLQNKANPNAVCRKGFTPIYYATKFSHLKIVKALLSHGAAYNAVSDSGETPSDFAVDRDITSLFKFINESFKKVKEGNAQVIKDLNKIKDTDTVKTVMSARNRENKTLVVAAVHSNFSKVVQLKQISQSDVFA